MNQKTKAKTKKRYLKNKKEKSQSTIWYLFVVANAKRKFVVCCTSILIFYISFLFIIICV